MLKKPSIKVFIALASLALLAVAFQFYFIPTNHFQIEQPKNIGYYEQYMAMKADEDGKIPTGMHAKWYAADQAKPAYKKNQTGIRHLQFIGPDNIGGRTRDLIIDASNTNRLLATSVSGGLWESKDAGKSWEPHNDFSVNLNITCIDQSPFNHKVFYYGTGEVIGSSDAPGEGIFKSTDGGVTFSQIQASLDLEFTKIWDLKHSITADSVFYVSVNTKGLYRSTNHGKSFQLVFPTTQHIHDIEVFPNGSVMFARQSRGVFFSETGDSNSFTQLTNGLPTKGFYRIELSTSPKFPKVVFAHYTNGVNSTSGTSEGVYKSSNAGKTWKLVGNPTGNGSFLQPYYTLGFEMSPHDTNFLVAGCTYPFYSTDGGKNWRRGRNSHADYHAFIFHPTNTDLYYACNDGGIFEYSVSTNRYIDRNYGFNATQYFAGGFAPDSLGVVGGTQDNGTHYQAYGNKNLDHVWGGDGAFCHINQQNPDVVYVSSQNGVMGKNTSATTNPGGFNYGVYYALSSAGAIDDGVWFINPFEMNYLNGDDLYFVSKRRVWYSNDAGEYWAPLTNYKSNFYSIGIPNEKRPSMIYAGGLSLLLYRIDDPINAQPGDEVSLRVNTPSGMTEGFIANIKVHPRINGIIYLAMSNYSKTNEPRVWKVEDADTDNPTWVNISGDLPKNLPCNWVEIDPYRPDSVFYAATDFGLYTTTNGGKNWIKESRLPNVIVSQIRMRNDDRRLFIYTHGRGIWFADLQKVEDYYASAERTVKDQFSVYPNPTTDVLSLNNESLVGKPYSIISIANGQEVANGSVTNSINVSQLAAGNYVLRITEEGQLRTAKFVKE